MKFNKPMLAAALGALATVAGEIVTWVFVLLGIASKDIYQIDSLVITLNRYSFFLGFVVNFVVGGGIAVVLNWVLSRYGADNTVNKAIAATLLGWFAFRLFSVAFIEGRLIEPRPLADYYVHLAGAVATGVTLGLLFKRILFKKPAS